MKCSPEWFHSLGVLQLINQCVSGTMSDGEAVQRKGIVSVTAAMLINWRAYTEELVFLRKMKTAVMFGQLRCSDPC